MLVCSDAYVTHVQCQEAAAAVERNEQAALPKLVTLGWHVLVTCSCLQEAYLQDRRAAEPLRCRRLPRGAGGMPRRVGGRAGAHFGQALGPGLQSACVHKVICLLYAPAYATLTFIHSQLLQAVTKVPLPDSQEQAEPQCAVGHLATLGPSCIRVILGVF